MLARKEVGKRGTAPFLPYQPKKVPYPFFLYSFRSGEAVERAVGQRPGPVEGAAIVAGGTRVLLTGAAGFLGARLAALLIDEGHEVIAVIRPDTNGWRLGAVRSRLRVIPGDLEDLDSMADAIRAARPELCIHLAWRGWSGKAEVAPNLASLAFSLDLLRKMPELGCGRFVAAGTCFEYDLSGGLLSESTPLRSNNLYSSCKKSLFEVAQAYAEQTGLSVATPRMFYSYGPCEHERQLVPSVVRALLNGEPAKVTSGEQVRDYLHVADVASAIWAVARSSATGAVNIASGQPVTVAKIATAIADMLGRPDLLHLGALPYRDNEPMHIVGDPSRLRATGWQPQYNLSTGLADTLEWWQSMTGAR